MQYLCGSIKCSLNKLTSSKWYAYLTDHLQRTTVQWLSKAETTLNKLLDFSVSKILNVTPVDTDGCSDTFSCHDMSSACVPLFGQRPAVSSFSLAFSETKGHGGEVVLWVILTVRQRTAVSKSIVKRLLNSIFNKKHYSKFRNSFSYKVNKFLRLNKD